jgi:hypothetical protein
MFRSPACRAALVVLVLPCVLLAGCSGSGGTTSGSPSPTATGLAAREAAAEAFVRCARANGAPGLQDPTVDAQGNVHVNPPPGVSPDNSLVQHVIQACASELQRFQATSQSPQSTAQRDQALTQFSACMRSHGDPNYPDPNFASTPPLPKPTTSADPAFQRAFAACQQDLRNAGLG